MKINKKRYYRISFTLESPLMLGSGKNVETDQDILRNKKGDPYIPASALAGVARSLFSESSVIDQYFGTIRSDGNNDNSRILFYDAVIQEEDIDKAVISIRDSVALNKYKTAEKGSKFDAEILETGIRFITWMEQNLYEGDETLADQIADAWLSGEMSFGAKTMRGYGETKAYEVLCKDFDLTKKEEVESWISFDMYKDSCWNNCSSLPQKVSTKKQLLLHLKQNGGLSIRRYTTDIRKADEKGIENLVPDSEQLTLANRIPVIPGTSWAGAFRHRMLELVPDIENTLLFGKVAGGAVRSRIRFSETQITGSSIKAMSHNAINRFSGAVEETALFTERTCYGGETDLCISWTTELSENEMKALAAAVADLQYGLLSVGGLGGIGRGCFTVENINDRVADKEKIYEQVIDILHKDSKKEDDKEV